MIIEIDDTKTIEMVIKEFSGYYPFLKIEFFDAPHGWQQASSFNYLLPKDKKIGEIRKKHTPGVVEIHSWHKTGSVEQVFKKKIGLNIQVFRRQGSEWIQTVGTDELTLEQQNEIAQHATQELLHGTDRTFENEKPV
jgi:hypothetical protein